MTDYSLISKELKALTSDVNDLIANLSNVSALLDIDSPTTGRFTEADKEGILLLQPVLEELFNR